MKKILITLASLLLSAGLVAAQDMAQATETYNSGAAALSNGEKASALEFFEKALKEGEACGEEGAEIVSNCKNIIPTIHLSIAKDLIKGDELDSALAKLAEAVNVAKEYGAEDVIAEAGELVPQVKMQKANDLLQAKNFTEAASIYKELTDADPTNGTALLRLAMALAGTGDKAGAIDAYKKAAEAGQAVTAKKQLGNIYLKDAASALKTKKYAEAVENALESLNYGDNAQAYLVAGQASQQLKKNNEAIGYFDKYLELSPNAKNASAITFTVAALYQQLGNKAKAIEYFTKVAGDAQFGAQAKQQIEALKK